MPPHFFPMPHPFSLSYIRRTGAKFYSAGPSQSSLRIRISQDCLWGNAICLSLENPALWRW